MRTKKEILRTAVDGIEEVTGLQIEIEEGDTKQGAVREDDLLDIAFGATRSRYVVEVKMAVSRSTAHYVARQI